MVLTDEPPLYRDLMRLKPDEMTPNGWAVKAGVSAEAIDRLSGDPQALAFRWTVVLGVG